MTFKVTQWHSFSSVGVHVLPAFMGTLFLVYAYPLYESPENPTRWVLFPQGNREGRLSRRKCGRGREGDKEDMDLGVSRAGWHLLAQRLWMIHLTCLNISFLIWEWEKIILEQYILEELWHSNEIMDVKVLWKRQTPHNGRWKWKC